MRALAPLLAFTFLLAACSPDRPTPGGVTEQALIEQRVWTRLHTKSPAKLRYLLRQQKVDVIGVHIRLGFVDVRTTPAERDSLVEKFANRIERAVDRDTKGMAEALSDYHDPAEIEAIVDQVVADHPAIAQKVELAAGLPEGSTIYAVKISDNVVLDEDEPVYLMDGQMHAREVMTAEVMLDAIEYLTDNYGIDNQVTRWVDEMEIWIVPVANPDGAFFVHQSNPWWRKNRSHDCGAEVGVDLNRNFAWNYRQCSGSDDYCSSDVYHGPSAASETETQTLQNLMESLRPLYYINYHSYGEMIIWSSACGRVEEHDMLAQVGQELNLAVETDSGQMGNWTIGTAPDILYEAPGGADDHAYGAAGAVAFTFELNSSGFQPDYASMRDITVQRQRAAWGLLLDRSLDGPSVFGHTFDQATLAPVVSTFVFANHLFSSNQDPLVSDANGRYNRVVVPNSEHVIVFTAPGYLPETRVVQVGNGPVGTEVPMSMGVNNAPIADAGAAQVVTEGDSVVLDASASSDPDGNTLFFSWAQTQGPQVSLQDAWSDSPQFFAPSVDADTSLVFEVVASDGELDSQPATVTVTVIDQWNETSIFDSTDTPISIPDNDPTGIVSIIHVPTDRRILAAAVHVDITHTWIGDLRILLTSPTGTVVVLHDHEGDSQTDLHADYQPPEFVGEMSGGDWTLFVQDTGSSDTGNLESWNLALDLVGDPACVSAADCDLPNVDQHACVAGSCQVVSCDAGTDDCNALPADGCEATTASDPDNCGSCGNTCSYPHAMSQCTASVCQMDFCDGGYADCNANDGDGCEVQVESDPDHCGSCNQVCDLPNAIAGCQAGTCTLTDCTGLWGDCDAQLANGCETDLTSDLANCGGCSSNCQPANAQAVCDQGSCTISACDGSYSDCDANVGNGCEVNLETDPDHCGTCDNSCASLNAEATCTAGVCEIGACWDGFEDCNADPADGCEAALATDPAHCGACDMACAPANAQGACQQAQCVISSCSTGFGNCNGYHADGCEADLSSDPVHCADCDTSCELAHTTAGCEQSACVVDTCDDAFGDCNSDPADGCETYLNNDDTNCGACGEVCDLPQAESECRQGVCGLIACLAGFDNCNHDSTDGCEANLDDDPNHCGACNEACDFANAQSNCQAGQCSMGGCADGYADCNATADDGCEVDLQSDPAHCGDCENACAGQQVCNAGQCGQACADADADGFPSADCGGTDCADDNAAVNPDGLETCNGIDDDCDGQIDEDLDCDSAGCGCSAGGASPGSAILWLLPGLMVGWLHRRRRQ
jgi:MYXO-CTERM domain-containing protein